MENSNSHCIPFGRERARFRKIFEIGLRSRIYTPALLVGLPQIAIASPGTTRYTDCTRLPKTRPSIRVEGNLPPITSPNPYDIQITSPHRRVPRGSCSDSVRSSQKRCIAIAERVSRDKCSRTFTFRESATRPPIPWYGRFGRSKRQNVHPRREREFARLHGLG